jgi:hypothetical protein
MGLAAGDRGGSAALTIALPLNQKVADIAGWRPVTGVR